MLTLYPVEGDTIPIPFATYGGTNGESITMTGLAVTDIEVYKDGGTTQRASDNGYTLLDTDGIDFDSLTGIHGFSIDLSDNSDSGFYAVGAWYWIVVSAVTVDSQTVSFVAGMFRIQSATRGMSGTALPDAAADAAGGLPISDAGALDLDTILDVAISTRLAPTTAGRTLDVSVGGAAGLDWSNVEGTLSSVALVNTTIAGLEGTIQTLDALDTAQDTQHATTQSAIGGLNNLSTADIDARLAAIGLDHLLSAAVSGTDVADNSVLAKLVSASATADWDDFVNTTDSLQAVRDRGDAAWITATGFSTHSAAAVVSAMGTGAFLSAIPWNAAWDAEVQSECADALTAFGWTSITISAVSGAVGSVTGNVGGNVTGSVGSLATQAKADVNAECDTAISDASLATSTELAKAVTYAGRILCIGAGNISNAQNAAEQYTITLDGVAFTVTAAGLDSDGNRGTTVFSEV